MSGLTPEQSLQITCVEWWQVCVPRGAAFLTAINPVPSKTRAVAGLSKAMGMVAGVLDALIVMPCGRCAFVEFKGPDGRITTAQRAVIDELRWLDAHTFTVRDLDEFRGAVRALGIPTREAA